MEAIGVKKVTFICTDNDSKNKKAWEIVKDSYVKKHISFYGCAAHTFTQQRCY